MFGYGNRAHFGWRRLNSAAIGLGHFFLNKGEREGLEEGETQRRKKKWDRLGRKGKKKTHSPTSHNL